MSNDTCPKCGAVMEYEDDPDQESWGSDLGNWVCANGHIMSDNEINSDDDYDDYDYEDE